MTYTPTWTQGDANGRVIPACHAVLKSDMTELLEAINRRRRLAFLGDRLPGLSSRPRHASVGSFRGEILELLNLPTGSQGGVPASPQTLDWIWPLADSHENDRIVERSAGSGEIELRQGTLGQADWTDPDLQAGDDVRAIHINQMRACLEHIRRGRWTLPIYFQAGITDALPDSAWTGWTIGHSSSMQIRSLGYAVVCNSDEAIGLGNVTARPSSRIELTADTACELSLYRCKREIDFPADPPTWNHYDPSAGLSWDLAGATGTGDAEHIATQAASAGSPCVLTGSAVASAIQAMIDGAPQHLTLCRNDIGPESIAVSGQIVVEFDLDSPPA